VTRVQRLFGNGYTPSPGCNGHLMSIRNLARPALPAVLLLAVLIALPPIGATPSTAMVPPGVASYNTGRVSVILPQELPSVELFQDANNSVSASLQVTEVLEIVPSALPHPTVVAAAFPNSVQGFNGTSVSPSGAWPITLSATLDVRHENLSLWSATPVLSPVASVTGSATLSVTYAPLDNGSAGAGVGVQWTIQNWPWVSRGDLLAVEMALTVSPPGGLTICAGSQPVGLALTPCSGQSFAGSAIAWGSAYDGLEGAGATGPVAAVSWNGTPPGSNQPYTVGAFATGNGSADLVLGAASSGATALSGGVGFALVAPIAPELATLVADAPVYFATVALAAGAAMAAVVAYRRRERRLNEEL
jgi:hypothetical protein